jgi:hypothetical protein
MRRGEIEELAASNRALLDNSDAGVQARLQDADE